jgi:geranylgeranyl diphosphate synthase type I
MSKDASLQALNAAGSGVDDALKEILAKHGTGAAARMYGMLGYFLGFLEADLTTARDRAQGKRFRPALCLLIAEGYGARDRAFDAALSIELFHNFTLIHDDIEDRDELRRGRPTLWKLFGVDHAINAGDALYLIACEALAGTESRVAKALFAAFKEVIEGQYMDFELAARAIDSDAVSVGRYMEMIAKKTGALVGIAAEAAGMCAGQNATECSHLQSYGMLLGLTVQLADDYRSVWSTQKETGKDPYGDIREHKRTLPFFFAREESAERARLAKLYSLKRQLSKIEIDEARKIIDDTSAQARVLEEIRTHASKARAAAAALSLPEGIRAALAELVSALVPEAK